MNSKICPNVQKSFRIMKMLNEMLLKLPEHSTICNDRKIIVLDRYEGITRFIINCEFWILSSFLIKFLDVTFSIFPTVHLWSHL